MDRMKLKLMLEMKRWMAASGGVVSNVPAFGLASVFRHLRKALIGCDLLSQLS